MGLWEEFGRVVAGMVKESVVTLFHFLVTVVTVLSLSACL